MSEEQPEYLAYLLRMWRVQEDGGMSWRASLERPSNGQRLAFTSLEAVFDFLRRQASATTPAPPAAGDREPPAG